MLVEMNNNSNFLSILNPTVGKTLESLAYCVNAIIKYTKGDNRPFVQFNLKDVNGFPVQGYYFDVDRKQTDGFQVKSFNSRPVKITYILGVYDGGGLRLTVENIETYDGPFPIEKFVGSVPDADSALASCNANLAKFLGESYSLPSFFATASYLQVCAGRAGGLSKLSWHSFRILHDFKDIPDVEYSDLLKVFYYTLIFYHEWLETSSKLDVILPSSNLMMINKVVKSVDSPILQNVITESCMSLTGDLKPAHLYAHLVSKTIKSAQRDFDMAYSYASMMPGTTKNVNYGEGDDLLLAKY